MKNTAIIIPTRLGAKRFPNKPLAKINNLPMIIHVLNRAKESKVGQVYVASPDMSIIDIVKKNGGKAILTKEDHASGSDRVYEAYINNLKNEVDLIINLQGDMPNIKPDAIRNLDKIMKTEKWDIGTLASPIKNNNEINDKNIVKVTVNKDLKKDTFLKAINFFRIEKNLVNKKIYHHIGIYAFTSVALTKYVKLSRSKLELERNLEQMRALENDIKIGVSLCDSPALSVDTEEDLEKVKRNMNIL
jgi:3-deoxy-manno-octulosonate cytidylyltransferase (CMP-KDO synthetase)